MAPDQTYREWLDNRYREVEEIADLVEEADDALLDHRPEREPCEEDDYSEESGA